jgi:hypothetical protein
MAYMDQATKAKLAANLKKVMPKGWKYSLAVRNSSTIVCTISEAPADILGEMTRCSAARALYGDRPAFCGQRNSQYASVNGYWLQNQFDTLLPTFQMIYSALNDGNHDRSDPQSDYFDVGWYVDVMVGRWNKPFVDTRSPNAKADAIVEAVAA